MTDLEPTKIELTRRERLMDALRVQIGMRPKHPEALSRAPDLPHILVDASLVSAGICLMIGDWHETLRASIEIKDLSIPIRTLPDFMVLFMGCIDLLMNYRPSWDSLINSGRISPSDYVPNSPFARHNANRIRNGFVVAGYAAVVGYSLISPVVSSIWNNATLEDTPCSHVAATQKIPPASVQKRHDAKCALQ
jgi:hypothetical protein